MPHRFVLSFARFIKAAFVVLAFGVAAAQSALPTVTVWATTSDGFAVLSPLGGNWARHGRPWCQDDAGLIVSSTSDKESPRGGGGYVVQGTCVRDPLDNDYYVPMTKEAFCNAIKNNSPSPSCTRSNFPAAPGINSASGARWAGNGCGSTPWTTALASGVMGQLWPGAYSGDINRPVAGNPSIDFALICNDHDANYTRPMSKIAADDKFAIQLTEFCNTSTDRTLCQGFANVYTNVVRSFGQSAYDADQEQLRCATWGNVLRASGCS